MFLVLRLAQNQALNKEHFERENEKEKDRHTALFFFEHACYQINSQCATKYEANVHLLVSFILRLYMPII